MIPLLMSLIVGSVAVPAAPPVPPDPEEVRFRNGDLALGGLWFVPEGEGPFPAAVFIRGSGPSTRDGYWTRSLVDLVIDAGVAVLLPDKRGSDASEGDWRTADFEDLAGDALAGVEFARARPEVDGRRVGLVGLSQGGKIAPVAASRSEAVAFVVDIVGAATDLREQVGWEMYHTFREAGVADAALQDALALQVLAEGYLEGAVSWEAYEEALREALEGPGAEVARGFPQTQDAWQWAFFRGVLDFDPIRYWREVTQPVLVLYGEDDHNAPTIRSAYRLLRLWREMDHPDATLRLVPEAGHALWEPDPADPHRPGLHPEVVGTLRAWLAERTSAGGRGAAAAGRSSYAALGGAYEATDGPLHSVGSEAAEPGTEAEESGTEADAPTAGGRVVLVTGSTAGLGREVARRLAARGDHVIVHGRDEERGAALVEEIESSGRGSARFYRADFAALENVRALASAIRRDYDRLDVLVNNAGILTSPDERPVSEDGHELHFQVNYLSGFLLTRLLLPLLRESVPARIINVSSRSASPLDFDDLMLGEGYSTGRAYGQSKLAQVMFTLDLAEQLEGTGVTVNAVHPATLMDTDLVTDMGMRPRATVEEGAEAVLHLIDGDDVGSGRFYHGTEPARAHAQAYDEEARARLRAVSEELTGI